MEAYSTSSSSSSAYMKATKNPSNCQSSLHSVRKSPLRAMKKPIAPLPPPTRPKVYQVHPMNFRDLVQKLTGAANEYECSSLHPRRLAPPPINVSGRSSFCGGDNVADQDHAPLRLLTSPAKTPFSALYKELMNEMSDEKSYNNKLADSANSSLGLSLSPSSSSWFSYPPLSPGSLSRLGL